MDSKGSLTPMLEVLQYTVLFLNAKDIGQMLASHLPRVKFADLILSIKESTLALK